MPSLDRSARRRVALWTVFGVTGLAAAAVLLAPRIAALATGDFDVLGTGFIANLALVFGSVMGLREGRRARMLHLRNNDEV